MTLNSSASKTADTVTLDIESIDHNFSIDMRSFYVVLSLNVKDSFPPGVRNMGTSLM